MRGVPLFVIVVVFSMFSVAADLRAATVNPPISAIIPLRAGGEYRGRIIEFDERACEVVSGDGPPRRIRWEAVQPRAVLSLNERLLDKSGTARQWIELGRLLHHMPGGGPALSARAFTRALKLEPTLKAEVESAKATPPPPMDAKEIAEDARRVVRIAPASRPAPPPDPTTRGADTDAAWGAESDEQLARATEDVKRHAARVHALSTARLELYETRYFLFYSNLPQSEARKWSEVLDRMYARLAHMFALEPADRNLWHGKALITVFLSRDDFLKFEKAAYKNDRDKNSGFSHEFPSGLVHIVFYRAPSDLDFARLLTHESTHGFLHRYRSSKRIPSWVNEGLAEVMEFELVPHTGLKMSSDARAKSELRRPEPLKDLFSDKMIENFQYPIVRTLSEFMIQQNRKGYIEFINAIKDGQPWADALTQKYGAPLDKVVAAYGSSMGVAGLKP